MSESFGYMDVNRNRIEKLFKRGSKTPHAYCVVTTEDDLVLVRKRMVGDQQGVAIKKIMLRESCSIEEDVKNNGFLPRLRGLGTTATEQAIHVEFLGAYRFVPPTGRELALPFAVELDATSDGLEVPSPADEWVELDWLEAFLTDHETPRHLEDSHYALGLYLDKMTFEETQASH